MLQQIIAIEWSGRLLVGLGALLAGIGSVLSGIAALRAARKEPKQEVKNENA